ncbi:MAG: alpha/beta hydrolase [Dehalococcoidales bacterium]|nr:alpha/beta hydrolase [Dehalococcoidales bacterium]
MHSIKAYNILIENKNIRYYQGGQGEPLLIIHGGNSHARIWVKNMKELYRNYTVYIPDLPGFGMSQPFKGNYYVPELTDFISKFITGIGLEKFNLMGHSLGGAVATTYALQFPEKVKRLVVIDSMCFGQEIALWVRVFSTPTFCLSIGKTLVSIFKGIKWLTEAVFRSIEFIIPFSEASLIIGCSAVNFQSQSVVLKHRLSEIVTPTLVVWGKNDRVVPIKQAYAAATVIPNCQLMVLKGGHSAYAGNFDFSVGLNRFLSEN